MPMLRTYKTNFTAGEVSRRLLGRGDLRAYENGALSLRNVFIHPTGGVSRRAGLRFVDMAAGAGRLIDFEFNTEQTYLLALSDKLIRIYRDEVLIDSLAAPWDAGQIASLSWTQSADTLLIVHPDIPPKALTRSGGGVWQLGDWVFDSNETSGVLYQPYFKFAGAEITVEATGVTGTVSLSASGPVFQSGHVGTRLKIGGREVRVTEFASPTVLEVEVIEELSGTNATKDWEEQAFSAVRGYPVSIAFHQDRLVIGGSRDLPNRLWMSKSGNIWSFDLGAGYDDEAIEFAILSDQVNAIRHVFSGRHLQVFTSGAEWQVSGSPLTPSTVQLHRQTRVGSIVGRNVPPVDVDGATIFVSRNGRELREFVYTDVEQAYRANDLALLAQHIIKDPVDQSFDQKNRLLHLALADGNIATLTAYRAEQVAAWTLQHTDGKILSVSAVGEDVYVLVERAGNFTIEMFDDAFYLDSALEGEAGAAVNLWSGLGHLEGREVMVVTDGVPYGRVKVEGGVIALEAPAKHVQVGLPFSHIVVPLPPNVLSEGGKARAVRMIEAVFRMENTAHLSVDVGRGLRDVPFRKMGEPLDSAVEARSGDIRVRAFGWRHDGTLPLWRIEQDAPMAFTLLSVSTDIRTSD